METKLKVAEILKDCPKGTKLYSPLYGECTLKGIEKKRTCDEYYKNW